MNRIHRQELFERHLIQFIYWTEYPGYSYRSRRRGKEIYGWQLCRDWEFKIDYLESIVLFGIKPEYRRWEAGLRDRMRQREERAVRKEFLGLPEKQRKIEAKKQGICFRCATPIAFLMIDCTHCGSVQE